MSDLKEVRIWTDGACLGNPGPGGWAALLECAGHRRELSGGFRKTTNNRMELMAVIAGLRAVRRPCSLAIVSDARYVVDGMTSGAMHRSRAAGWVRGRTPVPNFDLWEELLALCEPHRVAFHWTPGHAGEQGNERTDRLAVQAAPGIDLPPDLGYENPPTPRGRSQPTLFDRTGPAAAALAALAGLEDPVQQRLQLERLQARPQR